VRSESDRAALAYWRTISSAWSITPPRKPGPEDLAWYRRELAAVLQPGARSDALLLGVTPELAGLPWPASASLVSVDWSPAMLRNVWSPPRDVRWAGAICADWRDMPLATGSRDVAASDCSHTAVGSHEAASRLNAELRRVLRRGALYCARSFLRPTRGETVSDMFAELERGQSTDPDLFRWSLAMAVQGASRDGVALHDVWQLWNERAGDGRERAARNGWSEGALRGFEAWRGARLRFYFPTVEELEALCRPGFDMVSREMPTYAWPGRTCRLVMRAR
jgi:SAM-dependent methyltransferase